MKTKLYNELIQLYRLANDVNQTSEARKQASEDFEKLVHSSDDAGLMQRIIQDATAPAPSVHVSLLYTVRAAATDYSRNPSWASAAATFFRVGYTRLTNPTAIVEPAAIDLEEEEPTEENSFILR